MSAEDIESEILAAVGVAGVYVRGAWVLKSAQIFPPLEPNIANIRNYLLLQFAIATEYLERKVVASAIPTTPELVKFLLAPICVHVKGKGWRLKVEPDPIFEKK